MSAVEERLLVDDDAPRFHVDDQMLAPYNNTNNCGRWFYGAARVLDVEIDDNHVEQLTYEFLAWPGVELTCRADEVFPWTKENLLREINDGIADGGVTEFVQATPPPPLETVIHWLKLAAEHRNSLYFTCISQHFPDLPYSLLGHELLRLVWMPRHVPPVEPFWECEGNQNPHTWATDMEELVLAICRVCGIRANPEAVLPPTERTLEHVAASRGDTKLLLWVIAYRLRETRDRRGRDADEELAYEQNYSPFKRNDHGRTPLHLAVLFRQETIIDSYEAAEAATYGESSVSILDFNANDEDGQSALDLASAIEDAGLRDAMLDALHRLQRQIYQGILDRTISSSSSDTTVTVGNASLAHLEPMIVKYNLNVGRHNENRNFENAIYAVAEKGDLVKLRWLVENVKAIDLHCCVTSNNHRVSLLHAAARRSNVLRYLMERRLQSEIDQFDREKSRFLLYWNGAEDVTAYTTKCCEQEFVSSMYPRRILDACGETELAPHRIALAEWLVGKGLTLPDCHFLVHECDYAPAAYLLQYRFDIDSIISRCFSDQAPQAMLLVKEYLHGNDDARAINPRSVAFMCCERASNDPHKQTELSKLKFLQLMIQRYDVDPCTLVDANGRTHLQVALQSDYCLITLWLSANYRALVYIRARNGRLPIHIALADEGASDNICVIMCRFTGEADNTFDDRRLFALSDGEGKTVMDYMMASNSSRMRCCTHGKLWRQIQIELIDMIMEESTTAADFVQFARDRNLERLEGNSCDPWIEWFPFLHTAIGFGRLGFLCWLDVFFSNSKRPSLAKNLSRARGEFGSQIMLPIICHPDVEPMAGDLLEVQCNFRTITDHDVLILDNGQNFSPATLDGTWKVENWMPVDDIPAMMVVCDLSGTCDVAGMEETKFIPYEDGTIQVLFNNGSSGERWFTSTAAITPDIMRIELTRYENRYTSHLTGTVHPQISRKLVMTKIKNLDTSDIHVKWRLATVLQTTAVDLEVEYRRGTVCTPCCNDDLYFPRREWISRESLRINRSGILKLNYDCGRWDPEKYQDFSGKAFAERCGHDNIMSWIAKAETISLMKRILYDKENGFIESFFSGASNDELESKIYNARQILEDSCLPRDTAEALEASLYVLDRCWSEQPDSIVLINHAGQIRDYKPATRAASMGLLDRVSWILDTNRINANSPHIRRALMKAAQSDNLDVVEKLLSLGVAVEISLLEISLESLSGNVACFLLQNNLVPQTNLTGLLLAKCVKRHAVFHPDVADKVREKTVFRVKLLKMLGDRGCFPINPTEGLNHSTMEEFLSTLECYSSDEDHCVPLGPDALDVLCAYGGDIVSAMESQSFCGDLPPWIFVYIDKIKSDEKVISELLSNAPESADQILTEPGRDLTTLLDRCGRSLLQLAATTGKLNWVEWLINNSDDFRLFDCRGVSLRHLCQQLGHTDIALLLDKYRGDDEYVHG